MRWIKAVLGAAILLACTDARANGRFPTANQVVEDPSDARRLVVRTTFGILETRDGGGSWQWTCEQAAGYGVGQLDPSLVMAASGAVLVGVSDGITKTTDGCTWRRAGGPLEGRYAVDLARGPGGMIVAVTSTNGGRARFGATSDEGATWTTSDLPEDLEPTTIDVAPSRASRVYVVGAAAFPQFAALARSDDGGTTWETVTFDAHGARGVFLSGVDPNDPDRVYARFAFDTTSTLYTSRDRGTTWSKAFEATGALLGFAIAPTGDRLAIGGPDDGVLEASAADLAFARQSTVHTRCLGWTTTGLYACTEEKTDGFSLGLRAAEGAPFRPIYHLASLAPRTCPDGTSVARVCPAIWQTVGRAIGAIVDAPPDAGAAPPDAGGAPPPSAPVDIAARGAGCSVGRRFDALGALLLVIVLRRRARRTPSSTR